MDWTMVAQAFFSSLAPTLMALAALVASVRAKRAVHENTALTQEARTDTAVILGHVNSEKTADNKTIEFQAREIATLKAQIAEKEKTAALLMLATATRPRRTDSDPS